MEWEREDLPFLCDNAVLDKGPFKKCCAIMWVCVRDKVTASYTRAGELSCSMLKKSLIL